jgi:hypothetical protein
MYPWLIVLILIMGIYVAFKIKRHGDRLFAAQNALLAKYTFINLDQDSKDKVVNQTANILERGAITPSFDKIKDMSERQLFSFYALAMDELGIPPSISKEKWWSNIRNPFVSLINADKEIRTISKLYKKEYNIDIGLD